MANLVRPRFGFGRSELADPFSRADGVWVEVVGIEPTSFDSFRGLLRAQPRIDFGWSPCRGLRRST